MTRDTSIQPDNSKKQGPRRAGRRGEGGGTA
jgi:hypothetical protein